MAPATSLMKEYVRRQLPYWVDAFTDNLLPSDFTSKSFSRMQLVLQDIRLKPHRVAALLHLPSPLQVTDAHCIELTIAVPSWATPDKKDAAKPLLVHISELKIQVRNISECSPQMRRAFEARTQAALLEPDPLGSTASMLQFARDVADKIKIVVDKLSVQVFIGGVSRLELDIVDLNARATDALGQDVGDPAAAVDYSPDNLVQTKFKCVSFTLSVGVNCTQSGGAKLTVLSKASVVVRITRFYHRKDREDPWKRHLQLVEVNLGVLRMEYGVLDFMELYGVLSTLATWFLNDSSWKGDMLESSVDGMSADRNLGSSTQPGKASIELQITFRGTIEAKVTFRSPTQGPQELFLVVDRAAGNIITHRHGMRELQMSLHEMSMRFKGYVVLRLKPDREVFHLEQRRHLISARWRVHSIFCRIDDDLTKILEEAHTFVNEKEQPIVLRCGTCHQQIRLEMIDVHVCPPRHCTSLPTTPNASQTVQQNSRENSFSVESSSESTGTSANLANGAENVLMHPKLHILLHMDELELQTGSYLVQIMLKYFGVNALKVQFNRDTSTKLSNVRLTTESNEFGGDAVFVPALPLAFQMLECAVQGCGCILKRRGSMRSGLGEHSYQRTSGSAFSGPTRVFLDVDRCSVGAQECSLTIEKVQMRSRYSEGGRVCSSSQPQLGFHINVDRIRCQVDELIFQLTQALFGRVGGYLSGPNGSSMMSLFLGVLHIRVVEFTLQGENSAQARAKSLLKQAIVVFDNQLGYLCTQSSLDFKTVLNSRLMRFEHRSIPATCINSAALQQTELPDDNDIGEQYISSSEVVEQSSADIEETSMVEQNFTEEDESQPEGFVNSSAEIHEDKKNHSEAIDSSNTEVKEKVTLEREDACRCIQKMVRRRQLERQHKQRFLPDDYEPGVIQPVQTLGQDLAGIHLKNIVAGNAPTLTPRRRNLGIPSPITILTGDSDMAGEIRGGLTKLMSPLNRTLVQTESIRGRLNKLISPISRTLSPTEKLKQPASVVDNLASPEMDHIKFHNSLANKSLEVRHGEPEHRDNGVTLELANKKDRDTKNSTNIVRGEISVTAENHTDAPSTSNGHTQAKMAVLPDVVRVLVQVNECRLCIPINARAKVEFLCQEIVRRYNESFSTYRSDISTVSLQDRHGGVFSPSDIVGLVLLVSPSELLFAYPREQDEPVRSLARLATATNQSKSLTDADTKVNCSTKGQQLTQYSKLPLPLVIVLLANESERNMIRAGICERNGGQNGEEWPDLALNAASLDAKKNALLVEVAWRETCVEVTNGDAFALCRQMLGLCTSQVSHKYVGKILRARLKVDPDNPLVEWAYRRKQVMKMNEPNGEASASLVEEVQFSYRDLKKIVQDSFGVYTR